MTIYFDQTDLGKAYITLSRYIKLGEFEAVVAMDMNLDTDIFKSILSMKNAEDQYFIIQGENNILLHSNIINIVA